VEVEPLAEQIEEVRPVVGRLDVRAVDAEADQRIS
jgi:hypothetical protein